MFPNPTIRCGPAGWSYPQWNGLVYPRPKPRGFHSLEYLAKFVDLVEINTSFYQPLRPEVTGLWLHKVASNPSFVFTAKLSRRFSHERIVEAGEVAAFKEGLRPLARAGKLGCLVMQFPASFRFTVENREFFIRLRRTFHEFPLVAEMRHSSWMLDEALGTFIDYRVGFVNIDQPEHIRAMPPTAFLTTSIAYVRLHGRGRQAWTEEFSPPAERPGSDYLYSRAELEEWKARIERIAPHASAVYVVATNGAGARSVVNTLQMVRLLGAERRLAPPDLMARYWNELAGFSTPRAVQSDLFGDHAQRRAVA